MTDPMINGEDAAIELLEEWFFPHLLEDKSEEEVPAWRGPKPLDRELREGINRLVSVLTRIALALENANQSRGM